MQPSGRRIQYKSLQLCQNVRSYKNKVVLSLSSDFKCNLALKEGIFWADAKMNGIEASVHQYMGAIFENTVEAGAINPDGYIYVEYED